MSRLDDALHEVRARHPDAWIGGACAELADRFGLPVWLPRILFVLAFFEANWTTAIAYAVVTMALRTRLAGLLPAMTRQARARPEPPDAGGNLQRDRLAGLETRLARLEAAVTSDELKLRARFRDIEG